MPTLRKQSKEFDIPRGNETRPEGRATQHEKYTQFNARKIVSKTDHFREFLRAAGFVLAIFAAFTLAELISQGVFF